MKLRTGTEAWKVVTEGRESVLPLFLRNKGGLELIITVLKKKRILKKYNINSTIKAAKCASPILCFGSERTAREWVCTYDNVLKRVKIIRVVGYQEEKVQILRFNLEDWITFLEAGETDTILSFWPGTIGYRKVRVIT